VKCSACGGELAADARFCHHCGATVVAAAPSQQPSEPQDSASLAKVVDETSQQPDLGGALAAEMEIAPDETLAAPQPSTDFRLEPTQSTPQPQQTAPPPPIPTPRPATLRCAKCGTDLVPGETFCTNCGTRVQGSIPSQAPAAAPMSQFCANCGASMGPSEAFCSSCGAKVNAPAAPTVMAVPQSAAPTAARGFAPPPAQQASARARYCLSCGSQLGPADAFCPNCGTRPDSAGPSSNGPKARAGTPPPQFSGALDGVQYKGVMPRFMAALIDGVLYLILAIALASQFGSTSATASSGFEASFNLQGWPAALSALLSMGYMVLMEGYLGGTVGKLLLGIRVVDAAGNRPGFARALIRNVLRIIDALPLFYLLGIILVATGKQKRRIGDMAAGTYVVARSSVKRMKAGGFAAKPANTVLTAVAGVIAVLGLIMVVASALFQPQIPGMPSAQTQAGAKTQPIPTAVPTKAPSSGGGPFGISLPSISLPGLGGDPVDVAGKWTGSMSLGSTKIDGATAEEQKSLDEQMKAVKSMSIPMQFTFDGNSKDAGTVALGGGMSMSSSEKLSYKVSGDKVTIEGKVDDGKFTFEGKASKKGNSYDIEGTFKGEGPATGINKSKTMKIEGSWKATKQ